MYLDLEKITGSFSQELDDAVRSVKDNEAHRLEYLSLYARDNEMRAEGREEGRVEGREEGREEGLKEGQILQTVKLYRSLLHSDDEQIKNVIMRDFDLSEAEADEYLIQPAVA